MLEAADQGDAVAEVLWMRCGFDEIFEVDPIAVSRLVEFDAILTVIGELPWRFAVFGWSFLKGFDLQAIKKSMAWGAAKFGGFDLFFFGAAFAFVFENE